MATASEFTSVSDLRIASSDLKNQLSGLATLLQCPICLERFKSPRLFHCLHSLCSKCAFDHSRSCIQKPCAPSLKLGWVDCPVCRNPSFIRLGSGNILSLPLTKSNLIVEHWIQKFDVMEKYRYVSQRLDLIKQRLRTTEQSLKQNLSRLERLNAYEVEIRKSLQKRADQLIYEKNNGHTFPLDSNLGTQLQSEFDETLESLWRTQLIAMRSCERLRAIRCILELLKSSNKLPLEDELDPILDEIDRYAAGAEIFKTSCVEDGNMVDDRLDQNSPLLKKMDTQYANYAFQKPLEIDDKDDEQIVIQLWKHSFYEAALADENLKSIIFGMLDHSMSLGESKKTTGKKNKKGTLELVNVEVIWVMEEAGSLPGQLYWPVDIAFVRVPIYVLERYEDPQTGALRPTSELEAKKDSCVVVLAVCDKNNRRVQLMDLRLGRYLGCFAKMMKPKRIQQDSGGAIYVCDEDAASVKVFSPQLELLYKFGDQIFQYPAGMAITQDGEVIMTDSELCFVTIHHGWHRCNPNSKLMEPDPDCGKVITKFQTKRFDQPNPYYVTFDDRTSMIYVADSYNNLIHCYTKHGYCTDKHAGTLCPRGLAVDNHGNLIIADSSNNRVVLMSPKGKILQVLVSNIPYPMGVAFYEGESILAVTQAGYSSPHSVTLFRLSYNDKAKLTTCIKIAEESENQDIEI